MEITKAIIPAAGLGTRFLPFTKSVPKELLPLLNKPAIQYIIEESIHSHINQFAIITGHGKEAIANYFNTSPDLNLFLKERNKLDLLSSIEKIIKTAHFTYIHQHKPLGLGHAINLAQHMVNKEYFGVLLPDDIFVSKVPGISQLATVARQERASVIAVQEIPLNRISSYGVIGIKKQLTPNLYQVAHLVEKPSIEEAPSNLAIIGRYILSHKIFASLDTISTYEHYGELHLTDAIDHMLKHNEKVFALKVHGTRYDIGTPAGWLQGVIGLALQHPEYASHIHEYMSNLDSLDSAIYTRDVPTQLHTL